MRTSDGGKRLVGGKVELRRHDRKNYPLYARWYADREVWNLTSWTQAPLRGATVQRLFEDRELSPADDSFAIHRPGEDEPVGVVSLMNVNEANLSADLSIIVGSDRDRHAGFGSEAISLLLDYAFDERNLNRVGLSVFDFNEPARAAYEKLGFREEGRLRQALRREDRFHDAILMSILADEWPGSTAS